MKNQYVGDIGDYGKYGMLRYLAGEGIKIGVNWYLTPNDETNDGKFVTYLDDDKERFRDAKLFDFLREIANDDKNVGMIENGGLISGAVFFNEVVSKEDREGWHKSAMKALSDTELVFCDPDNGPIGKRSIGDKDADKYVTPEEIADYYKTGKNVVYYCQKARRDYAAWRKTKNEMSQYLPDAKLITLTFHKGTQRSFIFVIHPEDYPRYVRLCENFVRSVWGTSKWFTLEDQFNAQDKREDAAGTYLKIDLLDKTYVELRTRENGYVEIKRSNKPGMTSLVRAEDFVRYL